MAKPELATTSSEILLRRDLVLDKAQFLLPEFIRGAEELFIKGFTKSNLTVMEKKSGDFVTDVDYEIERRFRSWVKSNFPGSTVYGEEEGLEKRSSEWIWGIDPIDGTTNYVAGNPECSTVISLRYNDQPVLAYCGLPIKKEAYWARIGSGMTRNGEVVQPTSQTSLSKALLITTHINTYERMQQMLGQLWDSVGGVHMKMSSLAEVCDVVSGRMGLGVWYQLGSHEWPAAYLFAQETGSIIRSLGKVDQEFDYNGFGERSFIIAGNEQLFAQAKQFVGLPDPLE